MYTIDQKYKNKICIYSGNGLGEQDHRAVVQGCTGQIKIKYLSIQVMASEDKTTEQLYKAIQDK